MPFTGVEKLSLFSGISLQNKNQYFSAAVLGFRRLLVDEPVKNTTNAFKKCKGCAGERFQS
jgi:hypothetical protein